MTFYKSQTLKIIFLFIGFVLVTFILGGFILNGLFKMQPQTANVIVIITILFITWKTYKNEGKNLSELGLNFNFKNIGFAFWGFVIGGLFIIPLVYIIAFIKGYPVVFNHAFKGSYVLSGLWLLFPTVVLEELAFRGICFKKTVELTSVAKANIIFAGLFILSHWINGAAFGDPIAMTVLLITGLGHVLYATALLKSKTLYFPIGIHLGGNWVNYFVFSNLNNNDPVNGQLKPSLINVVSNDKIQLFNGQFVLTTAVTALAFLLFILIIRKWTYNNKITSSFE
jgi:membrane protease YdiL (CAAX protease family)